MPVKLSVGLSRKQGLPDYGSVGASCHLEVELPSDILSGAGTPLQRHVEMAFDACRQSVDAELGRHGRSAAEELTPVSVSEPFEPPTVRTATPKQLRAIERLILRLGMNPCDWLHERIGTTPAHALSVAEASDLIDELQNQTSDPRQLAG